MGRHASRRAANSANRKVGINAAAWFAGQSFTSAHRDPAPRETFDQMNARVAAEVRRDEVNEGIIPQAPDAASTAVAQQLHRHLSATMPGLLSCEACGRQVFTLVEGRCATCGRPAEGKNLRDMTEAQRRDTHDCGVRNSQHVDGWDGNWLDCAEAKRRTGR